MKLFIFTIFIISNVFSYNFDSETTEQLSINSKINIDDCKSRDDADCPIYTSLNLCRDDPIAAYQYCPHACNMCDYLDINYRCQREHLNISDIPAYYPGQIDEIFYGLEEKYNHTNDLNVLSDDPWIITIDNFINDLEISTILELLDGKFSQDINMLEWRTSSNAWCDSDCNDHEVMKSLTNKIVDLTSIPHDNYEYFQVLKYQIDERFDPHHDSETSDQNRVYGPRVLTLLMYLNDVEEGGETYFDELDVMVTPKKGRALLWTNVQNSNPNLVDLRTRHEAKPVINGVKYVANRWIHLYNFAIPYLWGCSG